MISRTFIIVVTSLVLAGCASGNLGSIAGGESKVFIAPEYVVLGKTQYDQDWIDGNIEAGIGGFGWQRPKPRPSSLDDAPAPHRAVAPVKKRSFINRIKDRALPKPRPAEIAVPPEPLVVLTPMLPPPPADPVEELLNQRQ